MPGWTADEVVDALVVLAPVIGRTRIMAAAPKVALATGFDVAGRARGALARTRRLQAAADHGMLRS